MEMVYSPQTTTEYAGISVNCGDGDAKVAKYGERDFGLWIMLRIKALTTNKILVHFNGLMLLAWDLQSQVGMK